MPELPEVEVTRRRIEPRLVGRTIREVVTTAPSYFFLTPPRELKRRLVGRRVMGLSRHGKYLLLDLDDGSRVLLHLGMTGQLFTASARSVRLLRATGQSALSPERQEAFTPDAHTHLVLRFADDGEDVLFRDVRKFGKVRWLPQGATDPRLDKLGPDALGATGARLFEASRSRKAAIKTLLLDQQVLAGVGNIYADEALWIARVHPLKAGGSLSRAKVKALRAAVLETLHASLGSRGSSFSDYRDGLGGEGLHHVRVHVFRREGQPCERCGTEIRKVRVAGRGTHYCPRCQRA